MSTDLPEGGCWDAPFRKAAGDVKTVIVVAAVLVDVDGRVLVAQRPEGKAMAGLWEFPGGKIEDGETLHQALARELGEELGIAISDSAPWRELTMDYPHARVHLNFCKVFAWSGKPHGREGQQMAWASLPVTQVPVLPGTIPVLRWLAEERGHAGPTHHDAPGPAPTP